MEGEVQVVKKKNKTSVLFVDRKKSKVQRLILNFLSICVRL